MLLRELSKALIRGEIVEWVANKVGRRSGSAARAYRKAFFPGLALLLSAFVLLVALLNSMQGDVKGQSIDFAVRNRLFSPPADPRIVILDIDERSLALLAAEHGRWPWPRSTIAEVIANLPELGVASLAFNVMMSDPDKGNPDADAIFNEVAATTPNIAFPLIRLNPANDVQSKVSLGKLSTVHILTPGATERTVAILYPFASGTHDKLTVANLLPDKDGIVRRYAAWWRESDFELPSMALRSVQLAGKEPVLTEKMHRDGIILNWRNKGSSYQRISFADVYAAIKGKPGTDLGVFRNAIVVMGVSAPGIATVKGTAADPSMDDNLIIATAIDDLLNDTHLRVLPTWAAALISLAMLFLIARAFSKGIPDKLINRAFVLAQSSMLLVTVGSVSFTHYLVDLSSCFFVVLAYFLIASFYLRIDRNATRGMPSFAEIGLGVEHNCCILIGSRAKAGRQRILQMRSLLEEHYGLQRTFCIDNAFGDGHLFGSVCKDLNFFLVFAGEAEDRLAQARVDAATAGVDCVFKLLRLPDGLMQRQKLEEHIGSQLLSMSGELLATTQA